MFQLSLAEALQGVWRRCLGVLIRRSFTGLPWLWPYRPTDEHVMVDARRMVRRHFGRGHHPLYRALAQVLATTAWPLGVLVNLKGLRRECGPNAFPMKRIPSALWAAMRHNILPSEYYGYALWRPDRRVNIDHYLYFHEASRLFKLLNRPSQPDPINDKFAFYEMCKSHALPTPTVLATFAPATRVPEFESDLPPDHDLFVKPRFGRAGEGTERLRWLGVAFESDRGRQITPQHLTGYLATRARNEKQTLLVQPLLSNHPSLGIETNAALATARLVTGLSADGDVIPIFGLMYFARSQHRSDVTLINVSSGRLIPAADDSGTKHSKQQLANNLDNGWALPDWKTVLQHIEVAHRACSNFIFVGWDLAFTDHGLMLLEGNANWNAGEYQLLSGEPLGHTKFTYILEAHLRHRR